jgi:hypothetical protein
MEEIAHTMADADLPDGFHEAAAEIYRRSPRSVRRLTPADATAAVLAALAGEAGAQPG